VLEPYELPLSNLTADEQAAYAETAAEGTRTRTGENAWVLFLADDAYTRPIASRLGSAGRVCIAPLSGLAVAEQAAAIDAMPIELGRE
jgi:hypothetical protein